MRGVHRPGGRRRRPDGDGALECRRCRATRPSVCTACGATRMKAAAGGRHPGPGRARAAGRPTGGGGGGRRRRRPRGHGCPTPPVLVGTEAVLHRVAGAHAVAFLDFDQELLAPRHTAGEQALALLARAARLVGGRDAGRAHPGPDPPARATRSSTPPSTPTRPASPWWSPPAGPPCACPRRRPWPSCRAPPPPRSSTAGPPGPGVEVLGPSDGRWLVRAPDHAVLADALAAAARPPGRLRVEVDPRRM